MPENRSDCAKMINVHGHRRMGEPGADHLAVLLDRHRAGHVYTALIPEVLLAIAPHQSTSTSCAYDGSLAASVAKSPLLLSELINHPYGVAERAYRLALEQKSISIALTGESGSGKTTNASLIIEYLARKGADDARLTSLLPHANVVLSAFGCADLGPGAALASRFERETALHFGSDGRAVCASVRAFGLDEWRVMHRPAAERTFGVFYQLLAGAPAQHLRDLHLIAAHADAASFDSFAVTRLAHNADALGLNALRTADSYLGLLPRELLAHSLAYVTDGGAYAHTVASMAALGIGEEERAQVNVVLAAILLLGNVRFHTEAERTVAADPAQVCTIARLLGFPKETQLEETLINFAVRARSAFGHGKPTPAEAEFMRDKFTVSIYRSLFGWLVRRVNTALSCGVAEPPSASVHVVDYAGFSAQRDSLSQLLFNHGSDRLHEVLATHYLVHPQRQYISAGLVWTYVDPKVPGEAVVDLLRKQPNGILDLLAQESSLVGRNPNASFLLTLCSTPTIVRSPAFASAVDASGSFTVQHVAGTASYVPSAADWRGRNHLFAAATILPHSTLEFIANEPAQLPARPSRNPPSGLMHTQEFLQEVFQSFTGRYFDEIFQVHCVRPNRDHSAALDETAVREQLDPIRIGLLLRLFRECYATYVPYKEFAARFPRLPIVAGNTLAKTVYASLRARAEDLTGVEFGSADVFMSAAAYDRLLLAYGPFT